MAKKNRFITVEKIFSESFNLYFKNILILSIPLFLIFSAFGYLFYRYFDYLTDITTMENLYVYITVMVFISLFFYILIYMEIKLISNAYTEQEVDFGNILKESFRRFFPFLWLHILFTLAMWLAMILLVIPAFILMFGWSVFQVVFVVEQKKSISSLKRSWNLTKGNKGRISLIYLMSVSAMYFFMIVFGLIFGSISAVSGSVLDIQQSSLIMGSVLVLFYSFLFPLFITFITVIYYNLRKEKEGFETEILAESFMEEEVMDNHH